MGGTEMDKISQMPLFEMNGSGNDWESQCVIASTRGECNET